MRDWKETLDRAARTFCQVAIPSAAALLVAAIQGGEQITWTVVQGVLVTACATGLAALMNLPQKPNGEDQYVPPKADGDDNE